MSSKFYEGNKVSVGLTPQALNGAGTGNYVDMSDSRGVIAVVEIGAMAAAATCAIKLKEAKDAAGTDAADITGATATITANSGVTSAKIVVGTVTNGKTVTVNDVIFTKAAATSGLSFADADGLTAAINANCDGLTAVNASGTITITSNVNTVKITLSSDDATNLTVSTLSAIAYVELDVSSMSVNDGFAFVAPVITNSASMTVACSLIRFENRHNPVDQLVAAGVAV